MTAVDYALAGGVATITVDDGKVNALSSTVQADIHDVLDRAVADEAVVVLAGRPGILSAGFDLRVMRGGDLDASAAMISGGFRLAQRLLSFPAPVLIACTGHAVAMGLFLLVSADYRVGADGPFRLQANEVAIGLTLPRAAILLLRHRLTPAAFEHAAMLATAFTPTAAVDAGLLDEIVAPDAVVARAQELAAVAAGLDRAAHVATKHRARARLLAELAEATRADKDDLAALAPPR